MEIIVTIILGNLVTNPLLSLFCIFVENQKQELNFQQIDNLVTRNFLFFVYSESRSTSKVCRIQSTFIKGLSYMLYLLVL